MLGYLAALAAGLFSGAAGYISLVEHPARLQAGPEVALAEFRPGFPRARAIQASLAASGSVFAALAWFGGNGLSWLLVALLLVGAVAFTLARIAPVYNRLLDASLTAQSPEAAQLLEQWGRLHAVRAVAGFVAFLIALAGL